MNHSLSSKSPRVVGVVGLGAMGSRIARRLLDAGHDVVVWNRTPAKSVALQERGARVAATPAELAAAASLVITMVADPAALRAVVSGAAGLAAGLGHDSVVVEMSTVGPAAVAWLRAALPADVALVDAPVLGSIAQAESGSLILFVGGSDEAVLAAEAVLARLGTVTRVGGLGTGAAAKLVANAALFMSVTAFGEAVALGQRVGLTGDSLYGVLDATPLAAQAASRRPLLESGEYPPRFSLSLARKDAELVRELTAPPVTSLRLVDGASEWLRQAETEGHGARDYTAVLSTITGNRIATDAPALVPIAAHDGLLVDLDGVVRLGDTAVKGAATAIETLRRDGTQIVFLTNDPQESAAQQAEQLCRLGIPAIEAEVVTSGMAAASFLRSQLNGRQPRVLVVGSPSLGAEVGAAGFDVLALTQAAAAEAVVVGGHAGFAYPELEAAAKAVFHGAELVATCRDASFLSVDGLAPATGAIVAAIETATGRRSTVVGKPEPHMFDIARARLSGCSHVAVVGDNLTTDIAGARRARLTAVLVLSGVTSRALLATSSIRPDFVFDDLSALVDARAASRSRTAAAAVGPAEVA